MVIIPTVARPNVRCSNVELAQECVAIITRSVTTTVSEDGEQTRFPFPPQRHAGYNRGMRRERKSGSLGFVLAPVGVLIAANGIAAIPFAHAAFGLIGIGVALIGLAVLAIRRGGA
jgi:hypothetical protein